MCNIFPKKEKQNPLKSWEICNKDSKKVLFKDQILFSLNDLDLDLESILYKQFICVSMAL